MKAHPSHAAKKMQKDTNNRAGGRPGVREAHGGRPGPQEAQLAELESNANYAARKLVDFTARLGSKPS